MAMVPQSWAKLTQEALGVGSMHDVRQWASNAVQTPMMPLPTESAAAKQNVPIHLFQGVSPEDYDMASMLARMVALGVKFQPMDIFEHNHEDYNKTSYRREATSKLLIVGMTEYEQVLYLDADGLVMQNMDHVFGMQLKPLAMLSSPSCLTAMKRASARVLLLHPSRQLHAQLQFVLRKDPKRDDTQLLNEFFHASELHQLPTSFAAQSCDLRKQHSNGKKQTAAELLQHAHYFHFADSPEYPQHWEWEDTGRVIRALPECPGRCAERAAWLYLYSVLAADRESYCLL